MNAMIILLKHFLPYFVLNIEELIMSHQNPRMPPSIPGFFLYHSNLKKPSGYGIADIFLTLLTENRILDLDDF